MLQPCNLLAQALNLIELEQGAVESFGAAGGLSSPVSFAVTDFSVGVSPTVQSVARGQTGNFTITLTPSFGPFDNPIALSCPNLAAGLSCSFSANNLAPGASPASVTLTVSTSGLAYLAPQPEAQAPLFAFWPALSAVVGFALPALGLLGVLLVRPGAKKAKLSLYVTLVLVLAFVGMQVACGGGGSPPPPPGGGGGQTFTITVTGTSGSLTHSAASTLSVR